MPKAPARTLTRPTKDTPAGQVYKLQIGFDEEERRMLESLVTEDRMPAAILIRQLILAEYRRRNA